MVGSPVVAAFVAQIAFWVLLVYGWVSAELAGRRVAVLVLLWLVLRIGLPYAPYEAARAMFPPFVAIIDIALVLMIFKKDVRLT